MPDAASAWPILAFTEPMAQNPTSGVKARKARVRARNSMASPMAEPLAAAST